MNKLDELLELWAKDSVIDRTEPGKELTNIPQLHSKYLNILSRHRLLAKEAELKYNRLKPIKWEYYTGKLDDDTLRQYGWEPFPFVLKSEINRAWPDLKPKSALAAQVEQETCVSLKSKKGWNQATELKTDREYGF